MISTTINRVLEKYGLFDRSDYGIGMDEIKWLESISEEFNIPYNQLEEDFMNEFSLLNDDVEIDDFINEIIGAMEKGVTLGLKTGTRYGAQVVKGAGSIIAKGVKGAIKGAKQGAKGDYVTKYVKNVTRKPVKGVKGAVKGAVKGGKEGAGTAAKTTSMKLKGVHAKGLEDLSKQRSGVELNARKKAMKKLDKSRSYTQQDADVIHKAVTKDLARHKKGFDAGKTGAAGAAASMAVVAGVTVSKGTAAAYKTVTQAGQKAKANCKGDADCIAKARQSMNNKKIAVLQKAKSETKSPEAKAKLDKQIQKLR